MQQSNFPWFKRKELCDLRLACEVTESESSILTFSSSICTRILIGREQLVVTVNEAYLLKANMALSSDLFSSRTSAHQAVVRASSTAWHLESLKDNCSTLRCTPATTSSVRLEIRTQGRSSTLRSVVRPLPNLSMKLLQWRGVRRTLVKGKTMKYGPKKEIGPDTVKPMSYELKRWWETRTRGVFQNLATNLAEAQNGEPNAATQHE